MIKSVWKIWNLESNESQRPKGGYYFTWVRGKMVPGKKNPRKNYPRKIGPRKNVFQKLFSVKRMLGNLSDFFIFIDWFHYTHKKMFAVHLTILHTLNCKTLKESRKVCCPVLGFHRLITSEHSIHTTMLDAHPTILCFWVFRRANFFFRF